MNFFTRARIALAGMIEAVREAIAHDGAPPPASAPTVDETETWPVPAQDPHTPESRALEWHPTWHEEAPTKPEPLQGSAAARVRATRGSE